MSRHAAPLDSYTAEDRVARLHEEMLVGALAHLDGLSERWAAPSGEPYLLDLGTGTLAEIITG